MGHRRGALEERVLGLSIAKQLIALMNGEIGVTSAVGTGTIVRFTIELQESDKNEETVAERPRRFSALRVLVADDQALNREILATFLKPLVYDIHEAEDGDVALQMTHDFAANGAPFDVVFRRYGHAWALRSRACSGSNSL